ncbi:hypothetical protein CKAN_01680300 [Cinnamomum micranthum f. kanehirae]|uniref:Uncharacterized protein n=1 Tax=Cinnamomum micranthum f. kanehirae TaxID=337451 RepID=A0A3S3QPZ8_9MAGN|nr:hypothetical protein CKAN_01680300 [Cinnamomum micranthum f. kanehirae]
METRKEREREWFPRRRQPLSVRRRGRRRRSPNLDVKDYNGRVLVCPARVSIINGIGKKRPLFMVSPKAPFILETALGFDYYNDDTVPDKLHIETVSRGLVFQFEEEVCTLYLFSSVASFSGKESER